MDKCPDIFDRLNEMSEFKSEDETSVTVDEMDRKILRLLQKDAAQSLEQIAKQVGASRTAVWNRVQRMQKAGTILRHAALVNPDHVGIAETIFIAIRTNQHNAEWLKNFNRIVRDMPEILEAHRLAGENDYLLKVQVRSTREFDGFYKQLVSQIDLYNVTSNLSMETLKRETALPI